ncbi:hypothetical protein HDV03_000449 [Kappamyces sp. JEL0829]|nr:hypothetical protein HDV03_000449 [Kappamyces sp. JEL0829]
MVSESATGTIEHVPAVPKSPSSTSTASTIDQELFQHSLVSEDESLLPPYTNHGDGQPSAVNRPSERLSLKTDPLAHPALPPLPLEPSPCLSFTTDGDLPLFESLHAAAIPITAPSANVLMPQLQTTIPGFDFSWSAPELDQVLAFLESQNPPFPDPHS